MENKIYKLNDEEFKQLINSSINIREVLFKLGYSTTGNSWGYSEVKKRMIDLNLSSSNFKGRSGIINKSFKIKNKDLFKENSKHARKVIRERIIKENLLEYKCSICGISEWNGKTLSLELDHINGINNDNRIENLRFLCPNCHSQTTTYGARNSKITESNYKVSNELENLILDTYKKVNNIKKVSRTLNVKEKVVHQVIINNGLYKSNQKYVIRYDKDHNEIMRFGCINEACNYLINNNECKTKKLKTCRATFLRNYQNFWLNSYWKLQDA